MASRLFFELRWAFPLVAVWDSLIYPSLLGDVSWWHTLSFLIDGFNWYMIRREKDDDDRWQRRMREARSKIVQTAGGLAVVPVASR